MQPTGGRVFVERVETDNKNKFVAPEVQYRVMAIGQDVTSCRPDDLILFETCHEYDFKGEKIIKVNESDIDGVCVK